MSSFTAESYFFERQSLWIAVALLACLAFSFIDWRFLRRSGVLVFIYVVFCGLLLFLIVAGQTSHGARGWLRFGDLALQPVDFMKLILIAMLSKYFSRRHIDIGHLRHIFVSAIYTLVPFTLVLRQPDFGSAMIVLFIWLGMVLVSGISKTHLLAVGVSGLLIFTAFWFMIFAPYQKARIINFIHPLADINGTGYNAFQSTVAVGSGEITGKGLGFGTQSRLKFLPQPQADFIFAAYAEEWGFVGALILLILCLILLIRITANAELAATNFETLFGLGVVVWFSVHIAVHAGMNMGVLPVTGITFPFMSYGGSHLLTEWFALGILSSMRRHSQGPRL
jgi:rod shape determining protein RodA